MKILYNWNSNWSITITIKFDNVSISTDQISYQGKWSIPKAIKDGDCSQKITFTHGK